MTGLHHVVEHCAACGQVLPLAKCRFPSVTGHVRRRVVEAIADNPGIGSKGIEKIVYASTWKGFVSRRAVAVHVHNAKPQLALDGWRIQSSNGPGGGYRLVRV